MVPGVTLSEPSKTSMHHVASCGRCLVGFVEPASVDLAVARAQCKQLLAPYMVPARLERLESMPRLPNGKTNMRALQTLADSLELTADTAAASGKAAAAAATPATAAAAASKVNRPLQMQPRCNPDASQMHPRCVAPTIVTVAIHHCDRCHPPRIDCRVRLAWTRFSRVRTLMR